MSASNLAQLLPARTGQAVGQMRRYLGQTAVSQAEMPPLKKPGDYVEILADYLVDEFDCMEIWLRWNGYSSYRELHRTRAGWVTLLCTAK